MKGRIFWTSLFLIGVSWVINSIYAHSKQLEEPIFLEHYIDTTLQETIHIPLYYLTNVNDSSSISYVTIDGFPNYVAQDHSFSGFGFNHHSEQHRNLQTFTHHAFRNVQLTLNMFELESLLQDGKYTFNEIEVFFNDGKNMTVQIGEITIYEDPSYHDLLDPLGGSSSSNGDSKTTYRVMEDLSIENIVFKHDDILHNYLFAKIDSEEQSITSNSSYTGSTQDFEDFPGIDIQNIELPYELKKDDILNIRTQFFPGFVGYVESTIQFSGTTKTGEKFTFSSWVMSQQPYLSQKDVNKMIQE